LPPFVIVALATSGRPTGVAGAKLVSVGVARSSSMIVTTAVLSSPIVAPSPGNLTITLKVSFGSSLASFTTEKFTVRLLSPGLKVAAMTTLA
jgi:hypothetical protein